VRFVPTQNIGQAGVIANRPDWGKNSAMFSEMSQKLPERFFITSMDSVFSLSAIDERGGLALVKPG
jgi:hypothetical protein